jgi:hypothetical protein
MNPSNYQRCVWRNRNGKWNYAVDGRVDYSIEFSSKAEADQAARAEIERLQGQDAAIQKPWVS